MPREDAPQVRLKFPYLQFFPKDHLGDEKLSRCCHATRSIWLEFVFAMHLDDRCGLISGSRPVLARTGRCTLEELSLAITELDQTGAADVTERDGVVTLINRRMRNEWKKRNQTRLRVQKARLNNAVTHPVTLSPPSGNGDGVSLKGGGAGGRDFDVEPPPGFPTLEQAKNPLTAIVYCTVGKPARVATVEFLDSLWNETVGRNYRDRQGQPVGKWHNYASGAWSKKCQWEDRNPGKAWPESNGSKPMSTFDISKIIEAKEKRVKELENRHSSESPTGRDWHNREKREEWAALKRDIKNLNTQLSDKWKSNDGPRPNA